MLIYSVIAALPLIGDAGKTLIYSRRQSSVYFDADYNTLIEVSR